MAVMAAALGGRAGQPRFARRSRPSHASCGSLGFFEAQASLEVAGREGQREVERVALPPPVAHPSVPQLLFHHGSHSLVQNDRDAPGIRSDDGGHQHLDDRFRSQFSFIQSRLQAMAPAQKRLFELHIQLIRIPLLTFPPDF